MTRILCVEDNEDNIYLVKMRLEMIEGFDRAANNARTKGRRQG